VTPARAGAVTENEVEDYLSEREQVDRIRQWWKENGAWIIVGIGGGVLSLAGWSWWQGYKLERAEQASAMYSVVAEAATEGRIEDVRAGVDNLAAAHGSSPYLQHGRLALAAAMVNGGDIPAAIGVLEQVLADASDPQIALIARFRLARLLVAEGEHDRALELVRSPGAGAFAPAMLEIEGDILAARGDAEGAGEAYRRALTEAGTLGPIVDEEFVRLKLEALGVGASPGGDAS
jgi:predicted negative regulator of RcsB-dependent stress response